MVVWRKIPRAILMIIVGLIVGNKVYDSFIDDGKCWRFTDNGLFPFYN